MRNAAAALASAALALTAFGCAHRVPASSELASGHRIYAHSCSACHSLTGHDTHSSGGDLANPNLTLADLASFARTMPVRPPLTAAHADAVARYIYTAAHTGRAQNQR
jgi:mono/diheme cytochrome c family protein